MSDVFIDNQIMYLKVDYLLGIPYVHCTMHVWNKTIYKAVKQVWRRFLHQMDQAGHPCVFSALKADDKKAQKFNKMFGFEQVDNADGIVLMMCKTEAVWELKQHY